MTLLQLNPPIELDTPKGKGLCWLVIDYGIEHHLHYTVAIHETGEIWTYPNPEVRATKNITAGRLLKGKNNGTQIERRHDRQSQSE